MSKYKQNVLFRIIHTRRFSGQFPGKPGLAGVPINSKTLISSRGIQRIRRKKLVQEKTCARK